MTPVETTSARRLLLLVGAIFVVTSMFYAALTPLLPEYVDRLDLSKASAGILTGAYAAGALLGTFPSAWLTNRRGPRVSMLTGLVLHSLGNVSFAYAPTIEMLEATRFVMGVGTAFAFTGGMGWVLAVTPPDRRGLTIGSAMGAAVAGVLLGPVLGAIARDTGPEPAFTAVAILTTALALLATRLPPPPRSAPAAQPYARAFRDSRVLAGLWLVITAGLVCGAVEVLAPLRLDGLGAGGLVIGAVFLSAAACDAVAQPLAGHVSDRRGRWRPIRVTLVGIVAFMLLAPLPQDIWQFAPVVVLALVVAGALTTPAMTLLSDGADSVGLDHGAGFALSIFAWAAGQAGGAVFGGLAAAQVSDEAVYLALALLAAATLAVVVIRVSPQRSDPLQP